MIVNLPPMTDTQCNCDAVYDFVIEHVSEANMCRFNDIASIEKWLLDDGMRTDLIEQPQQQPQHQHHIIYTENKISDDTMLCNFLRPGTKITIPKPRPNDIILHDIESVHAYLNQNAVYQSNFDDSDEIYVTTFDYSPPWNQYHNVETQPKPRKRTTKTNRVLTEKQPTATNIKRASAFPKKNTMNATLNEAINDESIYECSKCDRKYKRKSSLIRHEKSHLPKDVDILPQKMANNIPTQRTVIPINAAELIST